MLCKLFGRIFVIPVSEKERQEQRRRKVAVLYIIKKICMHKTEHFILLANPAERKNSAKVGVARKMISLSVCIVEFHLALFIRHINLIFLVESALRTQKFAQHTSPESKEIHYFWLFKKIYKQMRRKLRIRHYMAHCLWFILKKLITSKIVANL